MSYDAWKTRSPDDEMELALRADGEKLRALTGEDHGPFEDEPIELEEVYSLLHQAQADEKRIRDALAGLYGLIKLIYVGADPADEIRRVLATNHRSIRAAEVLGCERLDDPQF